MILLKIIIHDYAGHPFQLELSNYLSNNYEVYHFYFQNDHGPKADFERNNGQNLKVEGLGEKINYSKSNFISRFFNDIKYGKILETRINEIKPDIIISGNCPTLAQQIIKNAAKNNNSKELKSYLEKNFPSGSSFLIALKAVGAVNKDLIL